MEELQKLLPKEQYDSINIILDSIDTKKKHPIESDPELLGNIHHAINLDKYPRKEFRRKLFKNLPPQLQKKYFKSCNIPSSYSFEKAVKKAIEFEWGFNDQTKNFIDFFKYPSYLIPLEEKQVELEPMNLLMDYQSGIVFQVLKKLELPLARILIQMPTGTGKTRTAMDIIVRLLNENNKLLIIWFANKSELLEQAYETFMNLWKHAGKFDVKINRLWGDKRITKIPDSGVVFVGYQKFYQSSKLKSKPEYIFVDEAHQILAPTYENMVDSLIDFQKQTRIVGLTATPGRGINTIQNAKLVDKFHGEIVSIKFYDSEIEEQYENNVVKFLEDREILSRPIPIPLKTDFEIELTEDEWKNLTKLVQGDHPEYTQEFLKKLANNNTRNMLIVEELKKYVEEGKKILYFSTDVAQSVLIFAILQKLGIKAIHVDSKTDKKFRKQIIEKFKKTNEISVICNYDIFSTGFDVPNLDVVFIARPVNSPVLFNQMIGRGTRGPKMGGGPTFILVQVIDKIKSRFIEIDPYEQYSFWHESWKNY